MIVGRLRRNTTARRPALGRTNATELSPTPLTLVTVVSGLDFCRVSFIFTMLKIDLRGAARAEEPTGPEPPITQIEQKRLAVRQ